MAIRRWLEPPGSAADSGAPAPVVVLGSGVAGLSAAIAAADTADVTVVTKSWLSDTNTDYAQGGIAAVLSPSDTVEGHCADTVEVGQGICHAAVVQRVVRGGPAAIERLISWGGQFDRQPSGALSLGLEAGHSADRIVHAMGDGTGREIQRVLVDRVRRTPRITVLEHCFALDLVCGGGRVRGVLVHRGGSVTLLRAGAVIAATGGCGQVFRETTNPEVATGDGHAMLLRAGAKLRGMEFMQFHPTTLYVAGSSRLLISEAARGVGGILRDSTGVAFMEALHPRGELAPRDLLSRAVLDQMVKTRHPNVYLDLRHLPPAFVRQRFPRIHRVCLTFGLDITADLIPVTPAAHYMIGGAVVDDEARTSLAGLYAVGEVACSGLHGANRLASNSLLEGLVLGDRAGRVAAGEAVVVAAARLDEEGGAPPPARAEDRDFSAGDLSNSMKSLLWKRVGIVRTGLALLEAERRIESWQQIADRFGRPSPRDWELRNMLTVARMLTRAARERDESRGTHFRSDFPRRDDARWRADVVLQRIAGGELDILRSPVDAPIAPPMSGPEFGE